MPQPPSRLLAPVCSAKLGLVVLLPTFKNWNTLRTGDDVRLIRDYDRMAYSLLCSAIAIHGDAALSVCHLASSWFPFYLDSLQRARAIPCQHGPECVICPLHQQGIEEIVLTLTPMETLLRDAVFSASVDAPVDAARRYFQQTKIGVQYVRRCKAEAVPLTSHALVLVCQRERGVSKYAVVATYFGFLDMLAPTSAAIAAGLPALHFEDLAVLAVVRVYGFMRRQALAQCCDFLASVALGPRVASVGEGRLVPIINGQLPMLMAALRSFDAADHVHEKITDMGATPTGHESAERAAAWTRHLKMELKNLERDAAATKQRKRKNRRGQRKKGCPESTEKIC